MTRKDYVLLANVVKKTKDSGDIDGVYVLATNLADALQADNPRFDRDRFLKAAGVN